MMMKADRKKTGKHIEDVQINSQIHRETDRQTEKAQRLSFNGLYKQKSVTTDVGVLIPMTQDWIALHCKRDFAQVIRLKGFCRGRGILFQVIHVGSVSSLSPSKNKHGDQRSEDGKLQAESREERRLQAAHSEVEMGCRYPLDAGKAREWLLLSLHGSIAYNACCEPNEPD